MMLLIYNILENNQAITIEATTQPNALLYERTTQNILLQITKTELISFRRKRGKRNKKSLRRYLV